MSTHVAIRLPETKRELRLFSMLSVTRNSGADPGMGALNLVPGLDCLDYIKEFAYGEAGTLTEFRDDLDRRRLCRGRERGDRKQRWQAFGRWLVFQ